MKLFPIVAVGLLFGLVMSCNSTPKTDSADTVNAQEVSTSVAGAKYNVDTSASKAVWTGSKLIGDSHIGTINIQNGVILVDKDEIVGGSFVLDMKSVQPTDGDAAGNAKLKGHLSSSDFFAVDSFPTATFVITGVKAGADTANILFKEATNTVSGNLTIKGISKGIVFPAKISVEGNKVEADADFNIDRTQWDVNYGSENSIKDKIISKEIEFKLHLTANK